MSENKFKVWCKNKNEWETHGTCIRSDGQILHLEKGSIMPLGKENHITLRYTGLKDKNGKEIYEGDIIRFAIFDYNGADTQYKGVVKWANAMFEIWHDTESEYYGSDGGFVLSWVKAQDDEFEVIGNIHDNPELLQSQP